MKKNNKRYKNNLSVKLNYKGTIRKCFAQDFKDLKYRVPDAVKRAFKLNCNMCMDGIVQISNNEWMGDTYTVCGKRIEYYIIDRRDKVKEAARLLGQMGGQAGTGKKKVRGDSNYYRVLRMKGIKKKNNKSM